MKNIIGAFFMALKTESFCSAWSRAVCGISAVCALKGHYWFAGMFVFIHLMAIFVANFNEQ